MKSFEKSDSRIRAAGYQDYITVLKDLIERHTPKTLIGRRHRKRWWDAEVKSAIHARQEANRCHRLALRSGLEEIGEKWEMYQIRKRYAKQLIQQKITTADLATVQDIRCSGKDAPRKFWAYLGSLDSRDQETTIVDEVTGEVPNDLGTYLTNYLKETFVSEEPAAPQLDWRPTNTGEHSQEEVIGWVTILRALTHLKTSTSQGLDGIPASCLKSMGKDSMKQLAAIFSAIFCGAEPLPQDWRLGRVVLIPKKGGNRKHLRDYRPLTVTSTIYRVFARIVKENMATWAEGSGVLTELQGGFRRYRRLEDNLFTITQCIEVARKEERSLLCCFLDIAKAYDSVPHDVLILYLEELGLPHQWLTLIRWLYSGNTVKTELNGAKSEEVTVTRGLRQGCPLSPLLYILYVSGLERRLVQSGIGFSLVHLEEGEEVNWVLPGLTFADDIVLMAETAEDLQKLVYICDEEADARGLRFNNKKSAVMQLVGPQEPNIGNCVLNGEKIPEQDTYKYLGITLTNKQEYLPKHHLHLRQAAIRGTNVLRKRNLWSCNRFVVTRELWKAAIVPGLTFANAVICVPGDVREILERRQRDVGRQAVGCHGMVANEAVQGDLGWSSFEAREATSKIGYNGRLRFMDRNRWAKRLFVYIHLTSIQTRWRKRLYQLEKTFVFFTVPVSANTDTKWETEVRKRVREEEALQWAKAAKSKSTLRVYNLGKSTISAEAQLYDNSLGSRLLFEARAGGLRTLVYQQKYNRMVETTTCRACGEADETIEHIVLSCTSLQPSHPVQWYYAPENGQTPGQPLPQAQLLAEALGFQSPATGSALNAFLDRDAVAIPRSEVETRAAASTKPIGRSWKVIGRTKSRLEDWWRRTKAN